MNKSELKYNHELHNPDSCFFDRSTMRFFGDTMSNYYVPRKTVIVTRIDGSKVECYELRRIKPVKHGICGSSFFDAVTFKRILGEVKG